MVQSNTFLLFYLIIYWYVGNTFNHYLRKVSNNTCAVLVSHARPISLVHIVWVKLKNNASLFLADTLVIWNNVQQYHVWHIPVDRQIVK